MQGRTTLIVAVVALVAACSSVLVFLWFTQNLLFGRGWEDPAYAGLPTTPPPMRSPELQRALKLSFGLRCPCWKFNHWARVTFPAIIKDLDTAEGKPATLAALSFDKIAGTEVRCPPGTMVTDEGKTYEPRAIIRVMSLVIEQIKKQMQEVAQPRNNKPKGPDTPNPRLTLPMSAIA